MAQLRLQEPTLLFPGDRFILRQFSPVVTIGGGVIIDAQPSLPIASVRRMERRAGAKLPVADHLRFLLSASAALQLDYRIGRQGPRGLSLAEAVAETGWKPKRVEEAAAQVPEIVRIENRYFSADEFELGEKSILHGLKEFHEKNPLSPGMSKQEMWELESGAIGTAAELFEAVLSKLATEKKIELAFDRVRLAGRGVVMKDEEAEAKKTIENAFATAGLKVPYLKDVLAGLPVDKTRTQKIVTLLLRDKVLIKVSDELVFHRQALEGLRKLMAEQKKKTPKVDVSAFKDLVGVTRKYAIPLLEYLDRERVTRRVGDLREIL
jgi:selenocysteine-specific elongation factor